MTVRGSAGLLFISTFVCMLMRPGDDVVGGEAYANAHGMYVHFHHHSYFFTSTFGAVLHRHLLLTLYKHRTAS